MQTITHVSPPAHKQATCAWCYERFGTTVELLDHVDDAHLDPRMATPAEGFGQHATLGQPPTRGNQPELLTRQRQTRRTAMTTNMTALLERNEKFTRSFTPVPLALPAARVIIVTCLDHRVAPEITLGLRLGDAPVLRNAGAASLNPSSKKSPTSRSWGQDSPAANSQLITASKSRSFTTPNAVPGC